MKTTPSMIEPLEPRIAPATLLFVDAKTATYTDKDGDLVTVKFSKGILSANNVASVLVTSEVDATHDELYRIDLTVSSLATSAAGTKITVSVVPQPPADGFANVGYINATGLDLGAVTIRGDLGAIDAGDAKTKTPGLKSLTVQSFGVLGTSSGAPDLNSDIVGALPKLTVKTSMIGAALDVTGGKDGKVGSVSIGVTLEGGSGDRSGAIHSTGDMGAVKIGFDLRGGSGHESGALLSDGKIASVTIGRYLFGGGTFSGIGSGMIHSQGDLGKVIIKGDLVGGIGDSSGSILSEGKLKEVQIGGSLRGGIVKIGAGTPRNGYISSAGDMGKITINGSMIGTFLPFAASIVSGGKLASVFIGGAMTGGDADAGSISAVGTIGTVTVGGDVIGGFGASAGVIHSDADINMVRIGGNLGGGTADLTGVIEGVNLGKILIGGSVSGGNSQNSFSFSDSGAILATSIKSLTIGGGLIGGSSANQTLTRVGYVSATKINTFFLGGSLSGGGSSGTGPVTDSGAINADHIDSLVIGGSLEAGFKSSSGSVTRSGSINVTHDIGSLTIRGSVLGSANVPAVISAVGQVTPSATKDLAIGKIFIGGDVSLAMILAGYDRSLAPVNGGAQIGSVSVTGDWATSSLVAGAMNATSGNQKFGDGNDATIATGSPAVIAKITSIGIGGVISGTAGGSDQFGFVAHKIGAFAIGGIKIPLTATPSSLGLATTGDVTIHQI